MIVGQGEYQYKLVEGWEQLPEGWHHGDVAGVSTDSENRVYVFNRSEHPVIVYAPDGRFLKSWGEGVFTRPHGITIEDDIVYLADDGDHTVRKFTLDGKMEQVLGNENKPSDTGYRTIGDGASTTITHGGAPFNRPTRLSVADNGDLYVSDGYGNARIHRFDIHGRLLQSWGQPGYGDGEFMLPHSVWSHTDGRVFVCDRENDRIQIFSATGQFLNSWTNVIRPGDIFIDADNRVYIGEMYWMKGEMNLAGRIWPEEVRSKLTVRDIEGNVLSTFGHEQLDQPPCFPGNLTSPHGIWVDQVDDIYIGEVTKSSYKGRINDPTCHTIQKFARVR